MEKKKIITVYLYIKGKGSGRIVVVAIFYVKINWCMLKLGVNKEKDKNCGVNITNMYWKDGHIFSTCNVFSERLCCTAQ